MGFSGGFGGFLTASTFDQKAPRESKESRILKSFSVFGVFWLAPKCVREEISTVHIIIYTLRIGRPPYQKTPKPPAGANPMNDLDFTRLLPP